MTAKNRAEEIVAKLALLSLQDRDAITRLIHLTANASQPVRARVAAMLDEPLAPISADDARNRADTVIAYLAQQN